MNRFSLYLALLAVGLALPTLANAQTTVSSLPAASALNGSEKIPAMQGTAAVRIAPSQIVTLAAESLQPLDADLTSLATVTSTSTGRDLLTAADAAAIRTKAGLGTVSTQAASNVSITGGSVTGITDLLIADGGTGASTAANARANLGIGRTYVTGRYYLPDGITNVTTSATAPGLNSMRGYLAFMREPVTAAVLGVRISTLAAAGNVQMMLYAADATSMAPTGAALHCGANVSTAATGAAAESGLTLSIPQGYVWFFTNSDNATAVFYSISTAGIANGVAALMGSTSAANLVSTTGVAKSQTYGTCPTLTGNYTTDSFTDTTNASVPIVMFRK